jgi:hypothetical protein
MKKSKAKVRRFVNYLYRVYDVPRIPICVHWNYASLVTEGGMCCFGVFHYGKDIPTEIHIAGNKKIGTTGVLSAIAHEFVHYLQYLHGRDMDDIEQIENDAEVCGAALFGNWLLGFSENYRLKAWLPVGEMPKEEV